MRPVEAPAAHSHRPTQKQTNKPFKSKHTSKSALKDAAKGRTSRPSIKSHPKTTNSTLAASNSKLNRRNHAKQMQDKKRALLEDVGRIFSRKGAERVSRVVAVVPLTGDVDALEIVEQLLASVNVDCVGEGATRTGDVVKFHNQSLQFILLPPASSTSSLFPILDACAAADFVVVCLSSQVEVDEMGETTLRALTGTGVGASGGVIGVVNTLPTNLNQSTSTRSSLHSFLTHFFPTIERLACTSHASEASTVIRALCDKIPKGTRWREARPRILAEKVEWEATEGELGTLKVEGVVRGAKLSADRLVHLQGFGDFMIEKITEAPKLTRKNLDSMDSTSPLLDLSLPGDDADDLASTNVPDEGDDLLGEQTWPTEDEFASAPAASTSRHAEMLPPALPGTTPRRLKKVPKGTSSYQAAWIIDESDDDEDWDEDEESELVDGESNGLDGEDAESVMMDSSAVDDTASVSARPFTDLSPEQEAIQLQAYLADRGRERALQNRDDMDFPDEIDTPLEIPARERFARFRGMKSFRTSAWDPYEELPMEYSRCFMFEDFKRMGRKMELKALREGVEAGTRVVLHIKNVPQSFIASYNPLLPLVVFGLLKHEHKYSVMHFTIQRNTECTETVRSKDPLVVIIGPRRFVINPIFSQHTARGGGKGANNVHKFERFLRHGINATIATAYLPITFGSQPAVLLRVPTSDAPDADPTIHLIGTGTLLSSDPTRITAKRIILTGHPFKVHKKTATIRYMFFNQPDIEYYKPIALRTKRGRTGHIRESLGTHGYFKAGFDGPIDQMDQICLNLYKRCFPKWASVWDGKAVGAPKIREIEEAAEARGDVEMEE
ncbi:pre-rRNA-processing protein TSR1, partial [Phenoliferia sp. Uapishka_3]